MSWRNKNLGKTTEGQFEMVRDCYYYLLEAGWNRKEVDAELVINQIYQLHNITLDEHFVQQQLAILKQLRLQ